MLTALAAGRPASQQELAVTMGVAPSLMVSLADHLEQIGAIGRERDPGDRRRMVLGLTAAGRKLLARCGVPAAEVDEEVAAALTAERRTQLHRALGVLAEGAGLPV